MFFFNWILRKLKEINVFFKKIIKLWIEFDLILLGVVNDVGFVSFVLARVKIGKRRLVMCNFS